MITQYRAGDYPADQRINMDGFRKYWICEITDIREEALDRVLRSYLIHYGESDSGWRIFYARAMRRESLVAVGISLPSPDVFMVPYEEIAKEPLRRELLKE